MRCDGFGLLLLLLRLLLLLLVTGRLLVVDTCKQGEMVSGCTSAGGKVWAL